MKLKYGICIFLCCAAMLVSIALVFAYWDYTVKQTVTPEEPMETESLQKVMKEEPPKSTEPNQPQYMLRLKNGELDAYQLEPRQFLFRVGVNLEDWTAETLQLWRNGIYLNNEEELWDYVESLTS